MQWFNFVSRFLDGAALENLSYPEIPLYMKGV